MSSRHMAFLFVLFAGCTDNTPINNVPQCVGGRMLCGDVCVDIKSDPGNCGACAKACDQGQVCANGACQIVCPGGLTQCDRSCVDINSDRAHCGDCMNVCGDTQVCAAGKCAVSCPSGFTNCDGVCADLTSDPQHCSACGKACAGEASCVNGLCVASCMMPFLTCHDICIDPRFDPENCGACDMKCTSPPNHILYCDMGKCVVGSCLDGYMDCNGDSGDGCESQISTDIMNCGGCFNQCPMPPHLAYRCIDGMCMPGTCDPGYTDCNMDPGDGCEVNTDGDIHNCGKCGNECQAPPNIALTCDKGICHMGGCADGFTDCNMDPNDGCEVATGTDPNNCGACGNVCPMNMPNCSQGKCTTLVTFQGVKNDVNINTLAGWTQCFKDGYDDFQTPVATIQQKCPGKNIMLACRQANSQTLHLVAQGARSDVFFVTQAGNCQQGQATHQGNGVGWYFNDNWSWGFVKGGDTADLCSCDTNFNVNPEQRMCWHTGGGNINGGYRCGSSITFDAGWERLVFTAN